MKRYSFFAAAVLALFLTAFLVVEALEVAVLEDPRPALSGGGVSAALLGVALLVADALLPIPASLVMISLGTLFGAATGFLLSFAGRSAMAVAGFAIGRRGGRLLARAVPGWEQPYAEELEARTLWISGPLPSPAAAHSSPAPDDTRSRGYRACPYY